MNRTIRVLSTLTAIAFLAACANIVQAQTVPIPLKATPYNSHLWGRIANASHQGERIFSALFFAGPPNPNTLPLYTRHPIEDDRQRWANDAHIDATLRPLASIGLNTIKLSYWGHEGETDASAPAWLFSQTRWPGGPRPDRYSETEQIALGRHFFERARAQSLLVAPMLEVGPNFPFYAQFPGNLTPLVERAAWLLKNFGDQDNWLRVYDHNGQPRRVLWLIETIHAEPIDPAIFASGFDAAAQRLKQETGYEIGFILDPTPLPSYGPEYGPEPNALQTQASVLAINPFNITSQGLARKADLRDISEGERQEYAESVLSRWSKSGLPLIAPIMPGYDAHLVFPQLPSYGFNAAWRQRQKNLAVQYQTDGLSIDIWNGWSEGYAIPPSREDGDVNMTWARDVVQAIKKVKP